MIVESNCSKRQCKFYKGVLQPDGTESSERHYCDAFPTRIPDDIAYGDNMHLEPEKSQKNSIVFIKEEEK